jgi:hypothetical protein
MVRALATESRLTPEWAITKRPPRGILETCINYGFEAREEQPRCNHRHMRSRF